MTVQCIVRQEIKLIFVRSSVFFFLINIFCWQFSNQYNTACIDSVYFKQNSATFYSIQHNCILSVVHITINKLSNCYYYLLNTDVNCILLYFIVLYCTMHPCRYCRKACRPSAAGPTARNCRFVTVKQLSSAESSDNRAI